MKKDKTAWKFFHKENGPTFALGDSSKPNPYPNETQRQKVQGALTFHGEHEIAQEGSTDR